jgi:ABC-2 type transport system ATP-binding protein
MATMATGLSGAQHSFPNMIRPASPHDAAISLVGVEKRFGHKRAVAGLELHVPKGSLCGFLGPNGAGKSTTIRMIMSIIYPDSGSVRVLKDSALANKDRIGYLPEERGLYRTMKVGEFLVYMGKLKGLTGAAAHASASWWLERLELRGVSKQKCHELSKGMQQKVQFIASVIHDPELLILDEPFSGLDPVNTQLLTGVIQDLNRAGKTIVFSTHQMYTAEALCDRVVLINHGTKLLDATLSEVRAQFEPREIRFEPVDESLTTSDLASIEGASSVTPMDGPHTAFLVETEEGHDPQSVMRTILTRHAARLIELRRPTLNDIFIALVNATGGAAPDLSIMPNAGARS